MVERARDRAAHELKAAIGEDPALDDELRNAPCKHRARRASLFNHGHTSEQCARHLLAHAPRREVERVDVDRDAGARGQHMLTEETWRATKLDTFAIEHHAARWQRSAERAVERERPGHAIEVELRVASRVAAVLRADRDQFVALLMQHLRQRLQGFAALRKGHRLQRWQSLLARMREHCTKVDASFAQFGEDRFGGRIVECLRGAAASLPAAAHVVLEHVHP